MEIEELLAKRKEEAQKLKERNDLATKVNDGFRMASSSAAEKTVHALNKGFRVNNPQDFNHDTHLHIGLHGLEHLEVDSLNIGGLEEFLVAVIKEVRGIKDQIEKIQITPSFKLPEIKTPESKITVSAPPVTVNVPPVKIPPIPKAEVIITRETNNEPRKLYEKEIYRQGLLDGFEIGYEDGSKQKATGLSVGNVKYTYE